MATSAIATSRMTQGTNGTRWRGIGRAALALVGLAGLALLLMATPSAEAATFIVAPVPEDPSDPRCLPTQTWTREGSPYIIRTFYPGGSPGQTHPLDGFGTFCVDSALTIEPGVVVMLGPSQYLTVSNLHAVGTADEPILFTGYTENEENVPKPPEGAGWWSGIYATNADTGAHRSVRLEHVQVEFAGFDGCVLGFSRVVLWPPDCSSAPAHAIDSGDGDDLVLRDCEVRSSRGAALYLHTTGLGIVEGCDLHHNGAGIVVWKNDAQSVSEIRGNTIRDNLGTGVDYVTNVRGLLEDNIFARNDLPMRIVGATEPANNVFIGNMRNEILVDASGATTLGGDVRWEANLDEVTGEPIVYHVSRLAVAGSLTIDPGAIIEVVEDQQIVILGNAELVARGTTDRPILFTSDISPAAPGHWQGISLGQAATVTLENFTLEAAGAFSGHGTGALRSEGMPRIRVANCEIRNGLGNAVAGPFEIDGCLIRDHTGHGVFSPDTRLANVEIRDVAGVGAVLMGSESSVESSAFVRTAKPLDVDARTRIGPGIDFEGNELDRIDVIGGGFRIGSSAWPRFTDRISGETVRYHVRHLIETQGELTIDAGNVVEFEPGAWINVFGGSISAIGTEERPILFTSAAATPAPGDWDGIRQRYGDGVLRAHLANVTIEYATTGFYGQGVALVEDCLLRHNVAGAFIDGAGESRLALEGCVVRDNAVGVQTTPTADSVVRHNAITDNDVGMRIEGVGALRFRAYDNVLDNDQNAHDASGVLWAVPKTLAPEGNVIGGPYFGGNAWSDHDGFDCNDDGLSETPYRILGGGIDPRPLVPRALDTIDPFSFETIDGPEGDAGWLVGAATVTLHATDDLCGVARILYELDGGPTTTYAGAFVVGEGVHELLFWAEDNAGNAEPPQIVTLRIDATPPSVVASRAPLPNAHGWNNGPVTVSFACADATSGVLRGTDPVVLADEGDAQGATGSCTDVAGNVATGSVGGIRIDMTAPTASLRRPESGMLYVNDDAGRPNPGATGREAVVVGDLTVEALVSDDLSGIAQVRVLVDGRLACVATAGAGVHACLWRASEEALGAHSIVVVAVDRAGNEVATEARSVRTSATSPAGIVATLPVGREERRVIG